MTTNIVPVPGDIVSGKYRVERILGTGGMGCVFEATHQVTGKRFAVKWLLPDLSGHGDAVQRFIREAQVAGRFEHPNVVEVYDVGQERGSFFMVMELLQGESLGARLRGRGKLDPIEACGLIIPCLRGVHRAHQAGIVHRDLKPDNIYVCAATAETPETPKVLDFGISKVAARAGEVHASITRTGLVMGTPHYMSPEQLRGKEMDHRVDVYAFGVIMYELLSGKLPFPGDTYGELAVKIATETPVPLLRENPKLAPGLVAVVNRAMSRDPAARYPSLDELGRALEPFAGGVRFDVTHKGARSGQPPAPTPSSGTLRLETPLSTESRSAGVPIEPPRASRPLLLLLVAAAAIGVLGLGGVVVALMGKKPDADVAGGGTKPAVTAAAAAGAGQAGSPAAASAAKPAEPVADEPQPSVPDVTGIPSGEDLPEVRTVRIAPEPPVADRQWEPPAHAVERPEEPAAEPERDHSRRDERDSRRSERDKRTKGGKREPPPAPTSSGTATKPEPAGAPAGAAPGGSSVGRLGVQMKPDEF
jgi:eukaryotic-like serine/threonine-protein kinase